MKNADRVILYFTFGAVMAHVFIVPVIQTIAKVIS